MKKAILVALALSATSLTAAAGESQLSYNNVEFGYTQNKINTHVNGTIDGTRVSMSETRPKGYYLNGSVELGSSPFYVFGGYTRGTDTLTTHINNQRLRPHVTDSQFNVGLGYYYAINPRMNLVAETSYLYNRVSARLEGASASDRADDLRFAFGVDAMMTDKLEGWAKINYTKGDSTQYEELAKDRSHGNLGTNLGMQFKFNQTWGIVGQANFGKGTSGYNIGVRASF